MSNIIVLKFEKDTNISEDMKGVFKVQHTDKHTYVMCSFWAWHRYELIDEELIAVESINLPLHKPQLFGRDIDDKGIQGVPQDVLEFITSNTVSF